MGCFLGTHPLLKESLFLPSRKHKAEFLTTLTSYICLFSLSTLYLAGLGLAFDSKEVLFQL